MVFAPRDVPEIETALKILATSYDFACGKLGAVDVQDSQIT